MAEAHDKQIELLSRLKLSPREVAVALSYEKEFPGCLEEHESRLIIAKQCIALADGWAAPTGHPGTAGDVELLAMYSARFMHGITLLKPHTNPEASEVISTLIGQERIFSQASTVSSQFYTDVGNEGVMFLDAWAASSFARLEIGHKHATALYQTELPAAAEVKAPWPAWSLVAPDGLFPTFKTEGPARIWCTGAEPTLLVTVSGILLMVSRAPAVVADEVKKIRQLVKNVCLAIPNPEALRKPSIVRAGKRGAQDLEQARFILPAPVVESLPPTEQDMSAQRSYYKGQAIETRARRPGLGDIWRPAKVHKITSRGAEVVWADGPQSPQHVLFADIRAVSTAPIREAPRIGTPTLTAADIDRLNAKVAETAQAKLPAPEPQKLVLLRRPAKPPLAPDIESRLPEGAVAPDPSKLMHLSPIVATENAPVGFLAREFPKNIFELIELLPLLDGINWFIQVERTLPKIFSGIPAAGLVRSINHPITFNEWRDTYGGGRYKLVVFGPPKRPSRHPLVRLTEPIILDFPGPPSFECMTDLGYEVRDETAPLLSETAPVKQQVPRVKLRRAHHTTPIGNFLRGERLARQMDQRQLGDKIGISNTAVSNLELGHMSPSDDVLLAYALHLGLDIDRMTSLRDGEDPNGPAAAPEPPDPPRGIIAQHVPLAPPLARESAPKPTPEAPLSLAIPPAPAPPRDPGDVFAFLDFCAALTKLCPMPPDGRRDEWQRAAAALWSIR